MSDWADERREAFRRVMGRHGLKSAEDIARRTGTAPTTIRSYIGKNPKAETLSARTESRIAQALGVTIDALYDEDYSPLPQFRRVWVKGYAGAGAGVQMFEAMGENEGYYEVPRPLGVSGDLKLGALEIRGMSMPPFRDGDVVYYAEIDHVAPDMILNELCVVETADGEVLFKEVLRGYEAGTFNLRSYDGSPDRENVRLKRALPYVSHVNKRFLAR